MPDINRKDFPGNSYRERELAKEEPEETKKVSKVITGKIIERKKSFLDKVGAVFFGDDTKSVGSYIMYDVLIPAAKNTISEMVSSGIEMLLFGEARGSSTRRDKGKSYVSYNSLYRDRDRSRPDNYRIRSTHKFDDIIIETRGEAEEVLSSLVDLIDNYDVATVSDFYDLVGMTSDFTDNKYGWRNLNRATVNRVREGYVLMMPKPQPLD